MRKKGLKFFALMFAAWAGGFCAQAMFPMAAAAAKPILQADQLWVYGPDGKHRIQMGTYPSGGEAGQPLIGLSDNAGRLRLLFRLSGPTDSPVIVFKDQYGSDRLILGLDSNNGEAPYRT